jgi:hypothetical protein
LAVELPEQSRSQLDPVQVTEQPAVQVTWQVAPPLQVMLPLVPSVTSHVASSHWTLALSPVVNVQLLPAAQWALQEEPQVPEQTLAWGHARSALPVADQVQVAPAAQVHDAPEHAQAGPGQAELAVEAEPQPRARRKRAKGAKRTFMPDEVVPG